MYPLLWKRSHDIRYLNKKCFNEQWKGEPGSNMIQKALIVIQCNSFDISNKFLQSLTVFFWKLNLPVFFSVFWDERDRDAKSEPPKPNHRKV